jgi:SAM-dependent methyltransferase
VSEAIEKFVEELDRSLKNEGFVKLSLGNYRGAVEQLQKVLVRPVETKKGKRLLFQYRYNTRDITKNFEAAAALNEVRSLVSSGFRSGHLFTTSSDFQLTIGKKSSRLVRGKPTFSRSIDTAHDRKKDSLIDASSLYLRSLGIATDDGKIRSSQQAKWRQINKYLETLRDLFDSSGLKDRREIRIVDMGSGKGYLTFAAYEYFANVRGLRVSMIGVEARKELVEFCNAIAEAAGFEGLEFVGGSIADFAVKDVDVLIALHACDTATDDAIYKGIAARAELIIAAPCCHKEVRRQISPPAVLRGILKHGSMMEREAETITDGLRAMLLERSGYASKVFEFVPSEHTPKNNMIVGVRKPPNADKAGDLQAQIDAVKSFYGIGQIRLENLLA